MNGTISYVARALLATLFVVAGVRKALAFSIVAGMMAGKGFPMPEIFLALSIVLDIVGGIMLVINWNARYAALALSFYTLVVGFIFHGFWQVWGASPPEFANEVNHFFKNLAVAGGLLLFANQAKSNMRPT